MTRIAPHLFFIFLLALLTLQTSALAQSTDSVANTKTTPTVQQIQELTSKLNKEEISVLANLLELLAKDDEAAKVMTTNKPGLVETLQSTWQGYKRYVYRNVIGIRQMVAGIGEAIATVFGVRDLKANLTFIAAFFAILAFGIAADFIVKRWTQGWRQRIVINKSETLAATIKALGSRQFFELVGLAIFAIVVTVSAGLVFTDPIDEFLATSFIFLTVINVRLIASFLRLMLAPDQPALRLVSADDWTARFIYRKLVLLTGVVGFSLFLFLIMNRFEISGSGPFRFWIGLLVYIAIIYITWRARSGLTSIIRGEDEPLTPGLERMAAWWPSISIAIIAFQYVVTQIVISNGVLDFSPYAGVVSITLIVLAPFLDTILRGVIKHLVPPMQGKGSIAENAFLQTRDSYARIGRVLLIALLILVIFRLWGVSIHNIAAAGVGVQMAARLISSIIVVIVGYLAWEVTNLWINRMLASQIPELLTGATPTEGEAVGGGQTRLATILPLLRMTLLVAILTITVLLALSQLELNITPLLAGAGVFGLAIGFGAQTLVKDVVSGVFFLLDDAFRLGEFIDIGGTAGTVEKISVRSLQLRHPNGPVHIIPYGEIPKLTNNSRDYVIMKMRFTVPFDTDIEKVRKIFKKIGQEMMEDPELGKSFLEPFKSQGVADVDDVGIVVRGKFKTKPGAQWVIRKEIYTRVQKAFEKNHINFARKEVRVQIPGLDENSKLSDAQKEEITKAASAVASNTIE
jgi:small-conductance mechanosensitive channel